MTNIHHEAQQLLERMRRAGLPAFQPDVFGLEERAQLNTLIAMARKHNRIQERWCSEEMSDATRAQVERMEAALETNITEAAAVFGLRVHFDGDPRGFTVKLHTPAGDVGNTWGGDAVGYGIGEST